MTTTPVCKLMHTIQEICAALRGEIYLECMADIKPIGRIADYRETSSMQLLPAAGNIVRKESERQTRKLRQRKIGLNDFANSMAGKPLANGKRKAEIADFVTKVSGVNP